jgi:hypothetical protein
MRIPTIYKNIELFQSWIYREVASVSYKENGVWETTKTQSDCHALKSCWSNKNIEAVVQNDEFAHLRRSIVDGTTVERRGEDGWEVLTGEIFAQMPLEGFEYRIHDETIEQIIERINARISDKPLMKKEVKRIVSKEFLNAIEGKVEVVVSISEYSPISTIQFLGRQKHSKHTSVFFSITMEIPYNSYSPYSFVTKIYIEDRSYKKAQNKSFAKYIEEDVHYG